MIKARQVIKKLGTNELAVEWSDNSYAKVYGDGSVWYDGHWANDDELKRFAHWLDENIVLPPCAGCGQPFTPRKKKIWFEMNVRTHEAWELGSLNEPKWSGTEDSQGCFLYDADCARQIRRSGKVFFK